MIPDFATFFRAIWEREPFPWQTMLAERVAAGRWSDAIDLPTASGKTACLDIVVYALAAQADQLGSRLLFRGHGHSALAASIYAGLAGNDSLVLLDEAHCAAPFLQTPRAVQRFRSSAWAEVVNPTPFQVAVLSATPPEDENGQPLEVFPSAAEREAALAHAPALWPA